MEASQSPRVLRGDDPQSNGAVHLKLPVMAGRTRKAGRAQLGVIRSDWSKKRKTNGRKGGIEEDGKKQEEDCGKETRAVDSRVVFKILLLPPLPLISSSSLAKPRGESSQDFQGRCRRVRACLW